MKKAYFLISDVFSVLVITGKRLQGAKSGGFAPSFHI